MKHTPMPDEAGFDDLPRRDKARIYKTMGWMTKAIAEELEVTVATVNAYLNPAYAAKREEMRREWEKTPRGQAMIRRSHLARREREKAAAAAREVSFRNPDTVAAAEALAAMGWSQKRIARAFAVNDASVRYWIKPEERERHKRENREYNAEFRNERNDCPLRNRLRKYARQEARETGEPLAEVAERFGVA